MRGISKFVALMLIVAALAVPAVALSAACWTSAERSNSGMDCPPDCPMMAQESAATPHVTAAPETGSCCKISSNKPAPITTSSIPVSPSQVAAVPAKIAAPISVPASPHSRARLMETPAPQTSPQAVLCTFLI